MRLCFDIETNGLLDELDRVHCMAVIDVDTGREWAFVNLRYRADCDGTIEDGLELLDQATELSGHNIIRFDFPALKKVYGWEPKAAVFDTQVAVRVCWSDQRNNDFTKRSRDLKLGLTPIPSKLLGRHSLAAWGFRLGVHKGDYGDGRTDWSTFDTEMLRYCTQDTRVNVTLRKAIDAEGVDPAAFALEHEFAEIMAHQETAGFKFDVAAAERLTGELSKRRAKVGEELHDLFPPRTVVYFTEKKRLRREKQITFNPGSRDHIAINLKEKYGWEPTEFTKSGKPQIDESVLSALPYAEAQKLAEYFMLQKRLGQIAEGSKAWLKLVKDGRIHGGVIPTGTPHGRCAHVYPNMAQVPSVGKPYGDECRSLFGVSEGNVLVGTDASGMQLRGLAHFLARYDGGEYVEVVTKGDPHEKNRTAAGLPDRAEAKRFIYAFLFGAGPVTLGGGDPTKGKRLMGKFLRAMPALKRLLTDVKAAAKARGWIRGLDGRRIPVRSQHVALNYLLAGAEAAIMKKATCIFQELARGAGLVRSEDYWHVAHVHDEFQVETRERFGHLVGKLAVKAIQLAGEHFDFRCPLDGEYKVGANWKETH